MLKIMALKFVDHGDVIVTSYDVIGTDMRTIVKWKRAIKAKTNHNTQITVSIWKQDRTLFCIKTSKVLWYHVSNVKNIKVYKLTSLRHSNEIKSDFTNLTFKYKIDWCNPVIFSRHTNIE